MNNGGLMFDYYKKRLRLVVERMLGRRLLPLDMLPKGVDLYYDLNKIINTNRFETVFDVGANKGQSISEFLNWFPSAQIHAFEPSDQAFSVLTSSFSKHQRVEAYNFALGSASGEGELVSGENSERGSFHFEKTEDEVYRRRQVEVRTIDSFCHVNDIDSVNFIKIDTEGHDLEVIRGAKAMLENHSIDLIQVETTPDYENKLHAPICDVLSYMEDLDYKMYGIYDQVEDWRKGKPTLRRVDAVFARKDL